MFPRQLLVCLLIGTTILVGAEPGFPNIDPQSCAGAWLFDEEEPDLVQDISGNANHGLPMGDPKWEEGKFGQALRCDGVDDFIDCGQQESLAVGKEDFTLVAWMKADKTTPGDWASCVISRFDTTVPRHGYLFGVRGALDANNKAKPLFLMGLGQASGAHLFGTSDITDETWHHIAATVDRDGVAIFYRDGVFESQMDISAFANEKEDNALNLNIGADFNSRWWFQGAIDEVALFKAILTAEDIQRTMNNGLARVLGVEAVSTEGKVTSVWASLKQAMLP